MHANIHNSEREGRPKDVVVTISNYNYTGTRVLSYFAIFLIIKLLLCCSLYFVLFERSWYYAVRFLKKMLFAIFRFVLYSSCCYAVRSMSCRAVRNISCCSLYFVLFVVRLIRVIKVPSSEGEKVLGAHRLGAHVNHKLGVLRIERRHRHVAPAIDACASKVQA
jgi:hypothetical protein